MKKIFYTKKLKGKAKAMVVTQNIEAAIKYYFALNKILSEKYGNPFKILIAFSGTKKLDGIEYTEERLNGFPEKKTREKFDLDQYRILVVANKYLTGFDQPKLCAMYVDKKLQGVMAVQALSRLNRIAPSLGKKTEDLFILDFVNTVDEIKKAFEPFYTSTTLSSPTDVNLLHDLKYELDDAGIYEWQEVEEFNEKFFTGAEPEELTPFIDIAVERFDQNLEEEAKAEFKIKAKQFVKVYAQIAAIIPYEVLEWEKLFWYLKFLIPKLKIKFKQDEEIDEILNSVDLSTYALQRTQLNYTIQLDDEESQLDPTTPRPRSAHTQEKELDPLDEIIREFNERWFKALDISEQEGLEKIVTIRKNVEQHPDFRDKVLNNKDPQNREIALSKILKDVMTKQQHIDLKLLKAFIEDENFRQFLLNSMKQMLYL